MRMAIFIIGLMLTFLLAYDQLLNGSNPDNWPQLHPSAMSQMHTCQDCPIPLRSGYLPQARVPISPRPASGG